MAGEKRLICRSEDIGEASAGLRFAVSRHGRAESAFVIRYHGVVHAYFNRCGHVPVELDWQHGEFFDDSKLYLICATHGALYAPDSGRCLGGRCNGRGLEKLSVTEIDGAVFYVPNPAE